MKSLFLCLSVVFFSFSSLSGQIDNYSGGINGQKFDWLLYYLDQNYVDEVDDNYLTEVAIRSLVTQLDPYSKYNTKEEVEAQQNGDKGYSGKATGFNFYMLNDTALVTYIFSGGPAEKAGVVKGDLITHIGGEFVVGASYDHIKGLLEDKENDLVDLGIKRNRKYDQRIQFNKALVPWLSVNAAYMMTESIGYIKLGKFTLKTMEEFIPSLNYLKTLGMQELVLDLRGNNGGVRDQALELADVFLDAGKKVYSTGGTNIESEEYISKAGGEWERGKVAILQDAYSASASEIFIAAMQEWDRAVVIGVSTYGKGLIQQSYKLGDGSNIRLTIGRYYTPTGRHLQRTGTNNNDWLEPYKESLRKNSITKDLVVSDDLKSKTMGGRYILAGPGGIIPDIHYVFESKEDWTLINKLKSDGSLYAFTTQYVMDNRVDMIGRYKSVKALFEDRMFEAFMLKELRTYLTTRNPALLLPSNFPNNIINQVKTWMASQLWHDNAFYEAENMDDRTMFRAREVMENDLHDKLGVKY